MKSFLVTIRIISYEQAMYKLCIIAVVYTIGDLMTFGFRREKTKQQKNKKQKKELIARRQRIQLLKYISGEEDDARIVSPAICLQGDYLLENLSSLLYPRLYYQYSSPRPQKTNKVIDRIIDKIIDIHLLEYDLKS